MCTKEIPFPTGVYPEVRTVFPQGSWHFAVDTTLWDRSVGRGGGKTPKIPSPSASEPQKTALNSKVPSLLGTSNYQIAFYVGRFPEQFSFPIFPYLLCVYVYPPPCQSPRGCSMFSTPTLSTLQGLLSFLLESVLWEEERLGSQEVWTMILLLSVTMGSPLLSVSWET